MSYLEENLGRKKAADPFESAAFVISARYRLDYIVT